MNLTAPHYSVAAYGSAGQTAIMSPRGLVALMGAGYQDTRDRDAAQIVARLNAVPALLEALEDAEFLLRKCGNNPREALAMAESMKRSAADARAAIEGITL